MHDTSSQNDIKFVIMLAPNKSSVYPEYLPSFVFPGKEKFYQKMLLVFLLVAKIPLFLKVIGLMPYITLLIVFMMMSTRILIKI